MRNSPAFSALLLSLLVCGTAGAQQNTPPPEPDQSSGAPAPTPAAVGQVDFGFRGTAYGDNSDEARYQRYRDLRNGVFIQAFRWGKSDDHASWAVRANNVGYRDQQYSAEYNRFGKLKASFDLNQVPLFFSEVTRTSYTTTSPGVLGLGSLPAQIESGAATSAVYEANATPFDLRLKRTIADFRFVYSANDHIDLSASFKNTNKSGEQPWAGTFGFSDAVELAVPVDTRTSEIGVAAEWTGDRGQARVGYDGSFFSNDTSTLVWANPLRATDSGTGAGPAQGRMAIWPDSNLNSGSLSGSMRFGRGGQATGYLSLGSLSQNDALIPFTINAQLASPPLDRTTADASAQITATAFSYTAKPAKALWFSARFRSYDFDNNTPVFAVANTVSYDTKVAPYDHGGTSPFSFTRKLTDLDASWTPLRYAAFRAGYSYESVGQTFRTFDTTHDNRVRLSADTSGIGWMTLRAQYEYSHRVGTGLDEQSLDDLGEQTTLRQFDLSNRDANRFSTIVIVPVAAVSFNGSAFVGRDTRPDTGFGLLDNDSNGFSLGADYVPSAAVSLGASYQYEKYKTLQKSRQADPGPQFEDPTRDWTTTGRDAAHTFLASADLLKLWSKTDVRFAYDFVHAESSYIYGLAVDTTLSPVEQLPDIFNSRNRVTADVRYRLTPRVGLGVAYWFEKFTIDDFAFNPETLNTVSQPSFVSLQSVYLPYTANTFWARITVMW